MSTPRILAIGKATQDVFLKSDEFSPQMEGKVAYTHLPLGVKMEVEDIVFATGGNASNVAVTFARQGIHSSYMWTLGHDPASETVLHDLDAEGVDTSHVVRREKYRAGYSNILIATDGERTILNNRGVSTGADNIDLNLDAINDVDWVYPTSLALGGIELLRAIVDKAESAGAKVMLNPAGPELADPQKLKALLSSIDVLCVNKEEMQMLVDGETLEELVRHALHYVPVAIVSDGPRGVVASDGKTIVSAGMYEDVPVVDRTGAGDAFASGFLSQWILGKSLREAIVFASANSTSVVTKFGAKEGILHKNTELHDMPLEEKPY
ncbi:carbohydrate kinase family protein [Candidatus Saccharibacteria bacterium]|nr:carbohydrate kinase family protein [Candidatus Saccharibacteria bacterium]MBH2007216.1 carbohydrate kinase family protein [Candidatus Saccharibacteria bacterium]